MFGSYEGSTDIIFYVDNDLWTYRYTYTVGHRDDAIFKFNLENLLDYHPINRDYSASELCENCPIGGYCSGGCALSAMSDFERQCAEALDNFDYLVSHTLKERLLQLAHKGDGIVWDSTSMCLS